MKVGVIQLTSVLDFQKNLDTIKKYLKEAKDCGCEAVFLPECFYSMSNGSSPTPYLINANNEHYENIKNLAVEFEIAILGGSAAAMGGGNVVNRCFNFGPNGQDLGTYDKVHLFSCDIKKGDTRKKIDEGDIYTSGDEDKVLRYKDIKIGLGICVDVRFSEMALNYRKKGCDILTYSSAFTVPTGKAHWEILLRARAIEGQCFVIAPAQWGEHNEKISTYGHSMIIDPWGNILANAEEGEKLIVADIDLEQIQQVRSSVIMGI